MYLFLILLLIDLGTKFFMDVFYPNLVYFNKNMVLNIDLGWFMRMVFPFLTLPLIYFHGKYIKDKKINSLFLSLAFSGAIGNLISRFDNRGVIDFIPIPKVGIANFADLFIWASAIVLILNMFKKESVSNRSN